MRSMLQNDLGSYVQDAISAGAASSAAGLQKVLEIQRDWILNKAAGISENFDYSYGTSFPHTLPSPYRTLLGSAYFFTTSFSLYALQSGNGLTDTQAPPSAMTRGTSSPLAEVQSRSQTTTPTLLLSPLTPDSSRTDSTP